MRNKKSLFITFEGIEGSGKSYQSKKLYQNLKRLGINVVFTREPGGSKGAESIRKLILTGQVSKFSKRTDTLLYLAARNEHFEKKIKPLLNKRKIILCDRFIDSTIAYQHYGMGINLKFIQLINDFLLSITPN